MNAPRDGNDDPTGLLAEADAIRYGDQSYIPEVWREADSWSERDGPEPQKNGGGLAEPPPAKPPENHGLLTCAVTSCSKRVRPKARVCRGLCDGHRQRFHALAKKHGLTWPPPGRILRVVLSRRYQQGERLAP